MLSILSALAIFGAASAQNTATSVSAVHAAAATALTRSPVSHVPGVFFDRFVNIWLENTDFSTAMGDPNLAAFAKQGVLLDSYFGVTHPSEPNYVASISGDNFGMDNDNFNSIPQNVSTVVDLLEARGISWGEYQEDMPYTGFEGYSWINMTTHANDYVRKHNPAVIYQANDIPERLSVIKNFTRFQQDLASDSLPQWMFITPNMTDDAHDSSVTVAGEFLKRWLTPLLKNPNFMKRTLVLITFDENHTYTEPNRVMSVLLGDAVPENLVGTTDDTVYTHYSEIATVTANWNLNTLGRWDVGANVFKMVAERTGDRLQTWPEITSADASAFLNESYPGMFNSVNDSVGIPTPNIFARDSRGRTVLPEVIFTWAREALGGSIYQPTVKIPDGLRPPPGY